MNVEREVVKLVRCLFGANVNANTLLAEVVTSSLELTQFIDYLEERFEVVMYHTDFRELTTVGELVRFVEVRRYLKDIHIIYANAQSD